MPALPRPFRVAAVAGAVAIAASLTAFSSSREAALSPRFNHVMLYVTNLDSSIAFYTTAFDLTVAQRLHEIGIVAPDGTYNPRPTRMALLRFPGQEFVLELAERPVTPGESPWYQHLGVDVRDIVAASARVRTAGGRELTAVQTVRAGTTIAKNAFFRGPSGERVELMQLVAGEF
ncbi:MAG: VOC family protein [Gemmatimonadetes bacterium]|nr:VOC family protein [Gemmatimonadota bacterium]